MTSGAREEVDHLIAALGDKDGAKRMSARAALVQVGSAAVPALLCALEDPKKQVRWEAAKSLTALADPAAAKRLVAALADDDSDVRWVVAEALVALGGGAVTPLLTALAGTEFPVDAYRGAHHVIHDLAKQSALTPRLEPILAALDHPEPEVAVPLAATKALHSDGG